MARGRGITTFGGFFTSLGLDGASEPLVGEPLQLTFHARSMTLTFKKRAINLTFRVRSLALSFRSKRE